jgi:putative transferase (TIGR04331 family)
MNIPTVIFWNPKHWEIRGSAKPYFEDLKRVGVFHETPESAAKFVVTIWDDVESWWASREVRDAVNRFKEEYCTVPDDILDRVEVALQDAILPSEKLNINDSVD